jgi:glycosyltransferase involved in cell wall biosynthesis
MSAVWLTEMATPASLSKPERSEPGMRVLTLSYEFPPIGGGGSGVVKGLAGSLVEMGHTVDLVTMGFGSLPSQQTVHGINVYRVECGRRSENRCSPMETLRYLSRAHRVVRSLLASNQYDLVHAHFILPDGLLAFRVCPPRNIPYIITAHGSDVPGYNIKPFFRVAHPLMKGFWRRVTAGAAAIISPSETLKNLIETAGAGARVTVIPNGIAADRYLPREKKPQILVATRFVERKGVQYLLKALAGGGVNWQAVIVGGGEYEKELLALNDRLGQPAKFVGWLDNESPEFRDLLEESAIYALPSDYENFPVCLLEAMAAGCAIVTTSGHGCEEVVGDCAELVTPGRIDAEACVRELRAALLRLTTDPARCAALGARARQRLDDNFTWDAIARRYAEHYRMFRKGAGQTLHKGP